MPPGEGCHCGGSRHPHYSIAVWFGWKFGVSAVAVAMGYGLQTYIPWCTTFRHHPRKHLQSDCRLLVAAVGSGVLGLVGQGVEFWVWYRRRRRYEMEPVTPGDDDERMLVPPLWGCHSSACSTADDDDNNTNPTYNTTTATTTTTSTTLFFWWGMVANINGIAFALLCIVAGLWLRHACCRRHSSLLPPCDDTVASFSSYSSSVCHNNDDRGDEELDDDFEVGGEAVGGGR